jgi:dTDP-4-amino-4,6-dideoxygalactose transaminase
VYDIEFLIPKVPKFFNVKKYLVRMYNKNIFTNNGPTLDELEKKFHDCFAYNGNIVFCANGTLTLMLAYKFMGCKKALVPAFTFPATIQALHWAGIDYEFVDIHPTKWTISIEDLEEKIHKHKADLIVGVHSFGNPCNVQSIAQLAAINNCKVIYDAAPAISSFITENGKPNHISNYGDVSSFSMHATKALQAIEGGALFIKDKDLAARIKRAINFGLDDDRVPQEAFGINAKLSEIQASFAVCSLERLAYNQKDRIELVQEYYTLLKDHVTFQELEENSISTYQVLTVLLPKDQDRDLMIELMHQSGIQCRKYYNPPLHKVACFNKDCSLPVTEEICNRTISLPLHLWMTKQEVKKVCETLIAHVEA